MNEWKILSIKNLNQVECHGWEMKVRLLRKELEQMGELSSQACLHPAGRCKQYHATALLYLQITGLLLKERKPRISVASQRESLEPARGVLQLREPCKGNPHRVQRTPRAAHFGANNRF